MPLGAVSAATGGGGEKLVAFRSQNISSAKGQIVNIHNILGFAAHRTSCLTAFFVCCPTALEKFKTIPSLPCVGLGAYRNRPPGQSFAGPLASGKGKARQRAPQSSQL